MASLKRSSSCHNFNSEKGKRRQDINTSSFKKLSLRQTLSASSSPQTSLRKHKLKSVVSLPLTKQLREENEDGVTRDDVSDASRGREKGSFKISSQYSTLDISNRNKPSIIINSPSNLHIDDIDFMRERSGIDVSEVNEHLSNDKFSRNPTAFDDNSFVRKDVKTTASLPGSDRKLKQSSFSGEFYNEEYACKRNVNNEKQNKKQNYCLDQDVKGNISSERKVTQPCYQRRTEDDSFSGKNNTAKDYTEIGTRDNEVIARGDTRDNEVIARGDTRDNEVIARGNEIGTRKKTEDCDEKYDVDLQLATWIKQPQSLLNEDNKSRCERSGNERLSQSFYPGDQYDKIERKRQDPIHQSEKNLMGKYSPKSLIKTFSRPSEFQDNTHILSSFYKPLSDLSVNNNNGNESGTFQGENNTLSDANEGAYKPRIIQTKDLYKSHVYPMQQKQDISKQLVHSGNASLAMTPNSNNRYEVVKPSSARQLNDCSSTKNIERTKSLIKEGELKQDVQPGRQVYGGLLGDNDSQHSPEYYDHMISKINEQINLAVRRNKSPYALYGLGSDDDDDWC